MKKYLIFSLVAFSMLIGCDVQNDLSLEIDPAKSVVTIEPVYDVMVKEDIVYAKGLSHESLNSKVSTPLNLLLDVYYPDNNAMNKPAFMFIHGGGFSGGTKSAGEIVEMANYFATRGWVFVSVDYRVKDNLGTVPKKWLEFSSKLPASQRAQFLAMYPAQRDAKAALRWIAANANSYNIDTDYITVGGASAGAIAAITLGVSDQQDYRDELNPLEDETLPTTHLEQPYRIRSIIDFWGSKIGLDALEKVYGHQRFDDKDPSILIAHGTEDTTPSASYSSAIDLFEVYNTTAAHAEFIPLKGYGHAAWDATVDGRSLSEISFDLLVRQQNKKNRK